MSRLLTSEEHIIKEILAGNTGEFRRLVEEYQVPILRFARNLIGNEHDAEDITQDVFVSAFDHLTSFDAGRASLLTWLLTITRNRCLNYLKRKRPKTEGEISGVENSDTCNLERDEFWRCFDEALESLPVDQKTAFVLAEIEGLPQAQIAQIEETTLGTVKSRIHRAKQRLRAVLEPTFGEK